MSVPLSVWLFRPVQPGAHPLSCNATIIGTFVTYLVAFQLLYRFRVFEPRRELSFKDRIDWHARICSTFSALLVLAVSLPAFPQAMSLTPRECYYGYSVYQDLGSRFFVGFLLFDLVHMLRHRKLLADPMFEAYLVHHTLFIVVTLYAVFGSYFRYQYLWLIAGEISNPFVNMRWHLAVLGRKGWSYVMNGVIGCLLFGASRVILYGYGLWHIFKTRNIWLDHGTPLGFYPVGGLVVLAYFLNLYWFYAILRALNRAMKRTLAQKKTE